MLDKIKKNGLSPLIIILIIVSIAIGIFAISKSKDADSDNQNADQSAQTQTTIPGVTYQLPEGFAEKDCTDSDPMVIVYPTDDEATDCNDRTNTMMIISVPSSGMTECISDDEIEQLRQTKPVFNYECEKVTINDQNVLKTQLQTFEEPDPELGGGPIISYDFVEAPTNLSISYFSTTDAEQKYAEQSEALAQSVKFK